MKTFKWILGVLFLLAGFGALLTAPAAGAVYLFLGLFLIPPVLDLVERKLKFRLPAAGQWGIAIGAIVVAAYLSTGLSSRAMPTQNKYVHNEFTTEGNYIYEGMNHELNQYVNLAFYPDQTFKITGYELRGGDQLNPVISLDGSWILSEDQRKILGKYNQDGITIDWEFSDDFTSIENSKGVTLSRINPDKVRAHQLQVKIPGVFSGVDNLGLESTIVLKADGTVIINASIADDLGYGTWSGTADDLYIYTEDEFGSRQLFARAEVTQQGLRIKGGQLYSRK